MSGRLLKALLSTGGIVSASTLITWRSLKQARTQDETGERKAAPSINAAHAPLTLPGAISYCSVSDISPSPNHPSLVNKINDVASGLRCPHCDKPEDPKVVSHQTNELLGAHRLERKRCPRSENTVGRCRRLVRQVMVEQGVPGAVVAVAKDGEVVWSEGMGWADVENDTPCTSASGKQGVSCSHPFEDLGAGEVYG